MGKLKNLALKKEEIDDEIKLCEKEKKHLARQPSINISTYKKILKYFIAEWKNGDTKKREHIVKR